MAKLNLIELENNQKILVEVLDIELPTLNKTISDLPDGAEVVGVMDDMRDSMTELKESIANIATSIRDGFSKNRPDEFSVEIGFGFAGKGAIPFIVSAESNASIKIKATWKKDS